MVLHPAITSVLLLPCWEWSKNIPRHPIMPPRGHFLDPYFLPAVLRHWLVFSAQFWCFHLGIAGIWSRMPTQKILIMLMNSSRSIHALLEPLQNFVRTPESLKCEFLNYEALPLLYFESLSITSRLAPFKLVPDFPAIPVSAVPLRLSSFWPFRCRAKLKSNSDSDKTCERHGREASTCIEGPVLTLTSPLLHLTCFLGYSELWTHSRDSHSIPTRYGSYI